MARDQFDLFPKANRGPRSGELVHGAVITLRKLGAKIRPSWRDGYHLIFFPARRDVLKISGKEIRSAQLVRVARRLVERF